MQIDKEAALDKAVRMTDPVDELNQFIELSSPIGQPQLSRFIDVELTNGREAPESVNYFSEDAISNHMPEWLGEAYRSYIGVAILAQLVAAINDRVLKEEFFKAAAEYQLTVEKILTALARQQSGKVYEKSVPVLPKDVKRNSDGELESGERNFELLDVVTGQASEAEMACYQMLLDRVTYDLEKATVPLLRAWKREKGGVKRGHAAKAHSWLEELDKHPDWMDRVPRGNVMGWKVSVANIEIALQRLGFHDERLPNEATITRTRNKRLKEQNSPRQM